MNRKLSLQYAPMNRAWIAVFGSSHTTINGRVMCNTIAEWTEVCKDVGLTLKKITDIKYEVRQPYCRLVLDYYNEWVCMSVIPWTYAVICNEARFKTLREWDTVLNDQHMYREKISDTEYHVFRK